MHPLGYCIKVPMSHQIFFPAPSLLQHYLFLLLFIPIFSLFLCITNLLSPTQSPMIWTCATFSHLFVTIFLSCGNPLLKPVLFRNRCREYPTSDHDFQSSHRQIDTHLIIKMKRSPRVRRKSMSSSSAYLLISDTPKQTTYISTCNLKRAVNWKLLPKSFWSL